MHIFNDDGTCNVQMDEYTQECIDAFPEHVGKSCSTSSKVDQFTIDDKSPRLPVAKGDLFQSITMKVMYLAQRYRVDLQTTLAFGVSEWIGPPSKIGKSCEDY